jgi:hypothetical protein
VIEWEREFFRLAGFMLMSRFRVVNGYSCTKHIGHEQDNRKVIFHQLSYTGYKDAIGELNLMCRGKIDSGKL